MGYGCKDPMRRPGTYHYRAIEVTLVNRDGLAVNDDPPVVLTVDNDWDTLCFVKENMSDIASNMVRVKRMDSERRMHVEESAELFERNLEPLFTLISATSRDHVMDKLSASLRKALLLMAMDRYSCDRESMCRALGITKGKLERELRRCGLLHQERKAA
jgi:DNA-binding NtrC family response regulator